MSATSAQIRLVTNLATALIAGEDPSRVKIDPAETGEALVALLHDRLAFQDLLRDVLAFNPDLNTDPTLAARIDSFREGGIDVPNG